MFVISDVFNVWIPFNIWSNMGTVLVYLYFNPVNFRMQCVHIITFILHHHNSSCVCVSFCACVKIRMSLFSLFSWVVSRALSTFKISCMTFPSMHWVAAHLFSRSLCDKWWGIQVKCNKSSYRVMGCEMFFRFRQTDTCQRSEEKITWRSTRTREKYRLNEGIPECIATNLKLDFLNSTIWLYFTQCWRLLI